MLDSYINKKFSIENNDNDVNFINKNSSILRIDNDWLLTKSIKIIIQVYKLNYNNDKLISI